MRRGLRIALLGIAVGCTSSASPTEAEDPGPPPGGGQPCRTFATAWTSTSTFGQPYTTSASYSASARTYSERSPAETGPTQRRVTYRRIDDFVDETSVMGRFLFDRVDACAERSCNGGLAVSERPTYDAQRRMTRISTVVNGVAFIVQTYTSWDSVGRPTTGTYQGGPCTHPISITYDDVMRTITLRATGPGSGTLCIGGPFITRGYDADGNLISDGGSAGGTSTTTVHTVSASEQICK